MTDIKQSTARNRAFLMVQSSDHISPLTGATVTVTLSKNGGSFAAAGGSVTEIANGWYYVALTTTDTGTLGDLAYHCTATSGDNTDFVDNVVANILGDTLPANVTQISGSAVSTSTAQLGVNVVNWNGTVVATPATAGIPDVNIKNISNAAVSTSSAQIGVNLVNISGSAVSTSTAQLGVNIVNIGGSASVGSAGYVGIDWGQVTNKTSTVSLTNTTINTVTTVTNQLTAAAIATGVWQDATSGDFTVSSSIGKSLYTSGVVPGGSGGLFIAGSNAATTVNITGNLTGNVTGSVGSVTGAVGSVTGNVGGNVVGSVASVTAQVTANTTSWAGHATAVDTNNLPKVDVEAINGATIAAVQLALSAQSICSGTIGSGSTTTSFVTSALANPSSLTDAGQLIGRTIIFLGISGNSGHVQAQATNITSSTTGSTPTIGSTNALTTAPSNGDTFVVL